MKKILLLAAMLTISSSVCAQMTNGLVGKDYGTAIKGTPLDPIKRTQSPLLKRIFYNTTNGPQQPSVVVRTGGRELLVFETCTAHLCPGYHSVIAIDRKTGEEYAASFGDNDARTVIVPNPAIAALIDNACSDVQCNFDTPTVAGPAPKAPVVVQIGQLTVPEQLHKTDIMGFAGGAHCIAIDLNNRAVLYTEGKAVFRFHGQLRVLHEDGIGGDALYSVSGPPIVVMFSDRPGKVVNGEESSIRPRTLTILSLSNNQKVSYPVMMKCES